MKNYLAEENIPICRLDAKTHFEALDKREKLYAHHISKACWYGARIILEQTTKHSSTIFDLIISLVSTPTPDGGRAFRSPAEALSQSNAITPQELQWILEYFTLFLSNLSNYRSFGDTKFIPRVSQETFAKFVDLLGTDKSKQLYEQCKGDIFGIEPASVLSLGYPDDGNVIGYYSDDVTKDDIKLIQSFCESLKLDPLNTRLFKQGPNKFELRVASVNIAPPTTHTFQNTTISITYGDFAPILQSIAHELQSALPYSSNTHQHQMLEKYISHFKSGSIEEHKESQREWIQDVGPVVETNIGFVETYRDPAGVRAEFEGFVAVVNKEMTKKFERLVQEAPRFIERLPWGKDYEKDKFLKPDFTSLEVVNFATGGIPAGINIPNYDDIRQTFGFKNVSLGNVLNAKAPNEKINFISASDLPLFEKLRGPAFEVQVGIHELLGHGTGKLFQQNEDGTFNFDKEKSPINPLTGKPIDKWYNHGETYNGIFKEISSSYEECKAESVAMVLSTDFEILEIFGFGPKGEVSPADVTYICWLQMARAGLSALEFYSPNLNKWGQAHMQARYAILQVFLKADGLLTIHDKEGDQGRTLEVHLNKDKIWTDGLKAMKDFLLKLQVLKSTGDAAAATEFYNEYTKVAGKWLEWREEVLKKKQPRKVFVQGNTIKATASEQVDFRDYPATLEGVLLSFVERDI